MPRGLTRFLPRCNALASSRPWLAAGRAHASALPEPPNPSLRPLSLHCDRPRAAQGFFLSHGSAMSFLSHASLWRCSPCAARMLCSLQRSGTARDNPECWHGEREPASLTPLSGAAGAALPRGPAVGRGGARGQVLKPKQGRTRKPVHLRAPSRAHRQTLNLRPTEEGTVGDSGAQ